MLTLILIGLLGQVIGGGSGSGATGPTGPQGATGATGAAGATGATGPAGSSSPGGSSGEIQYNNAGALGGYALNTSGSGSSATQVGMMAGVQAAIDAKTLAGAGAGDAYKVGVLKADGLSPRFAYYSFVGEMTFEKGGSVLTPEGSCVLRDLPSAGVFSYVAMASTSATATTPTDVSGSVTVRFYTSPRSGSTTWTAIGDVSLTSASSVVNSTLTGWTTVVAAASRLAVCITGTPTTVTKLVVSPGFNADPA